MTAPKNPENIYNGTSVKQFQLLSSLHLLARLENPTIFTKMWTFSLGFTLFASAECPRMSEEH